MFDNQKILKILREEDTDIQKSVRDLLKTKGIHFASSVVGGFKNVVKILNLDVINIDTQEMLVKNFINFAEFDDVEISFLEVNRNRPDKVRIKIFFETDSQARNMETWVVRTLSDEINKFFPFKSMASWEPSFAGRGVTIVLASEQIKESEEDGDIIVENKNNLKDKVLQLIYNKGLFIAGKSVGGFKNLIGIIGIDELVQNLKPPFFHNMYNLAASNYEQDKIIEELLSYYLSKDVNVGKIEGLNDGGDIYVEDKRGNYIYFESFDGKEWDMNEYDDKDNNLYYEDSDGWWKKMRYDDDNIHVYTLDSFGNEWGKNPKKNN